MKDDNKIHATDTLKDIGHDTAHHAKEAGKDIKATMKKDYDQTKEDINDTRKHGITHGDTDDDKEGYM